MLAEISRWLSSLRPEPEECRSAQWLPGRQLKITTVRSAYRGYEDKWWEVGTGRVPGKRMVEKLRAVYQLELCKRKISEKKKVS